MIDFFCEELTAEKIQYHVENIKNYLDRSGVIIYPTDTLYGLGASIYEPRGVRRVFSMKKRCYCMPLSVAVGDFQEISKVASFNDTAIEGFCRSILPGSVTILLQKNNLIDPLVTGGSPLVGVRIPDHDFIRHLLREIGPITSTSVNSHSNPPMLLSGETELFAEENNINYHIRSKSLDNKMLQLIQEYGTQVAPKKAGSTIIKPDHDSIDIIRAGEMPIGKLSEKAKDFGLKLKSIG